MLLCPETTAARALTYPISLPAQHEFKFPRYYVRPCYLEYYNLVIDRFKGGYDKVTVTGTAAIGKSTFLAYFFTRYCIEHPNETVIMVSFTNTGKMKDALVWTRQGVTHTAQCMSCMIEQAETKARQEGRPSIRLYDGALRNLPARTRVLCCTRALERWDNLIASDQRHAVAPWDISELLDARAKLKLEAFPSPVSREDITSRYDKFGGVARVCLSQRKQYPSQVEARIIWPDSESR
ncbi:hypothetical protein Poli38472_007741 [Pythium oligandrum]|uniref:Uncharacterized protein n=1 Tax=Pythium oligandrum TaxID=41045 RepID=A0A8K1FP68_PYTOL|nr:hypothetical protein Poli38472_007741 [Pythium oligandrum]|eukprot:TMW68069.1 hypothetical protein Poli38472_007741 [Pythium oligandrum]